MAVTLKGAFEKALGMKVDGGDDPLASLRSADALTLGQAIVFSIIEKAMHGDLQAAAFIRDITGQKAAPKEKKEKEQTLQVKIVK